MPTRFRPLPLFLIMASSSGFTKRWTVRWSNTLSSSSLYPPCPFWPSITIELAMPFTSRAFLASVISIRLYPARIASLTIHPAAICLTKQEWRSEVVALIPNRRNFGFHR
jgi:hypothetical protein